MATIKTYPFQSSTILRINSEKDEIKIDPHYQRQGGVWTLQKKQLLIDSILNDYDIPKLYFHALSQLQREEYDDQFDYTIIDGRQRLEAIWEFIEGRFAISDDFTYLADRSVEAAGLTYSDLASAYPKLKIYFDSYLLPIILVQTEDLDLIEDMFSRLNEAVPLNAAEKRNAFGGNMARIIRDVANNVFFTLKVRFGNNRYQHREVAARLLFLIDNINRTDRIADTKKPFLDKMVLRYRDNPQEDPTPVLEETMSVIFEMNNVFADGDALLRSQSSITVYFLLFRRAIQKNTLHRITRQGLIRFYNALDENRASAVEDITQANYEYLEFERMSQQGTNDAFSIRERTRILAEFLGIN